MLILTPILVLLLAVVMLTWPTRTAARLVGAVQASYPMAIIAVIAGTIVTLLTAALAVYAAGLAAMGQPPAALMLLPGVLVAAFVYAKLLETSFFGGITVYLVQALCASLFTGLLYFGAAAWKPDLLQKVKVSDLADLRTFSLHAAADVVCACGSDPDCRSRTYREFRRIAEDFENAPLLSAERTKVAEYTRRAKLCALQPETSTAEPPAG
jgi:hypothetical protein